MKTLVAQILVDGEIDSSEAAALRTLVFADGKVDNEEITMLAELNEKATVKCSEFAELFVDAFKAFALEDDATPGVVDEDEADFILALVNNDGEVDDIEKSMIIAVYEAATSVESAEFTALYDSIKS